VVRRGHRDLLEHLHDHTQSTKKIINILIYNTINAHVLAVVSMCVNLAKIPCISRKDPT
jgi:hypothetical protein